MENGNARSEEMLRLWLWIECKKTLKAVDESLAVIRRAAWLGEGITSGSLPPGKPWTFKGHYIKRHAQAIEAEVGQLAACCWPKAISMLGACPDALPITYQALVGVLDAMRMRLTSAARIAIRKGKKGRAEKVAYHMLKANIGDQILQEYRLHLMESEPSIQTVGEAAPALKTVNDPTLGKWVKEGIGRGLTNRQIERERAAAFPDHEVPSKRRVAEIYRRLHLQEFGEVPKVGVIHPLLMSRRRSTR